MPCGCRVSGVRGFDQGFRIPKSKSRDRAAGFAECFSERVGCADVDHEVDGAVGDDQDVGDDIEGIVPVEVVQPYHFSSHRHQMEELKSIEASLQDVAGKEDANDEKKNKCKIEFFLQS